MMANPSRAKGTDWEVELLPVLQELFGDQVDRAPLKGTADYGDFLGVPWLHEAKSTERPTFQKWARTNAKKAGLAWVTLWHGDRRKPGNGPFAIMPIEFYELLVSYAVDDNTYERGRLEMLKDDLHLYMGEK